MSEQHHKKKRKLSGKDHSRAIGAALITNLGLPLLAKYRKYLKPEYQNQLPARFKVKPQPQKPLVLGQAPPDLSSPTLAQAAQQYRLAQSVAAENNQLPPNPPMVR